MRRKPRPPRGQKPRKPRPPRPPKPRKPRRPRRPPLPIYLVPVPKPRNPRPKPRPKPKPTPAPKPRKPPRTATWRNSPRVVTKSRGWNKRQSDWYVAPTGPQPPGVEQFVRLTGLPVNGMGLEQDNEFIRYVSGLKKSWQNPCTHIKLKCTRVQEFGELRFLDVYNGDQYRSIYGLGPDDPIPSVEASPLLAANNFKNLCPIDLIMGTVVPPLDKLAEFSIRARNHAISTIDEEQDLTAFLVELYNSCKNPIKMLKVFREKAVLIRVRVVEEFNKILRDPKRYTGSELAAWHLAWVFGLKPFLKDITDFVKKAANATQRADWLRDRGTKPTLIKSGGKIKLAPSYKEWRARYPAQYEFIPTSEGGDPFQLVMFARSTKVLVSPHCSHMVRYNLPDWFLESIPGPAMDSFFLLSFLGVGNPIASAWELTGYSWLIDWFIGYRDKCTVRELSIPRALLGGDASVLGAVSSVKIEAEGEYGQYVANKPVITGRWKLTWYDRFAGEISIDAAPHFVNPFEGEYSFDRLKIIAALGAQRFFNRR